MSTYYEKDGKRWFGGKITLGGRTVFKEYFADKEFGWADIAYAMFGCALYLAALALGIGLYAASH